MDILHKSFRNMFVSKCLERAHDRRKDAEWLDRTLRAPSSCFLPLRQSKILVSEGDAPRPVYLKFEHFNDCAKHDCFFFLGLREDRPYFAVDVDGGDQTVFDSLGSFRDLRGVAPLLSMDDGALFAYAKTLIYWNRRNNYCGVCGERNESREGGHLRACSNEKCGVMHFPRTDPAIIVLIKHGERALLGRQHVWPERMYSVLAGFVEPGESAEGAVYREVFEEVGVRVKNVHYQSSQPWPFPCSLMLGFTAEAEDDRITLGDDELEDARWFGRGELLQAIEKGSVKLPTSISISYRLIEEWYNSEKPFRLEDLTAQAFTMRNDK